MKSPEVGEVPIEAAARDAKLARKHIRLQSVEALVCERPYGEINPVLYGQSLGHDAAPYSAVLTATMCRTGVDRAGAAAGNAAAASVAYGLQRSWPAGNRAQRTLGDKPENICSV